MIPENSSQFKPWMPELKVGMKVKILSEAGPKDNPKLKSPFYCDVDFKGKEYCLNINWTSYGAISKSQAFGVDTKDWIGKEIIYKGKTKTKMGALANVWFPVEPEIDLNKNEETPF